MTHKIALFIALFASLGTVACTVDAPERENFDYSFQEEIPEDFASELGFAAPVFNAEVKVRFGDSHHGVPDFLEKVGAVDVVIGRVQIQRLGQGDTYEWITLRNTPLEVDLLDLADGSIERIAAGPIADGRYGAIAIEFSEAYTEDLEGEVSKLRLPGMALYIEDTFRVYEGTTTELIVRLGALRTMEPSDDGSWRADPNVNFQIIDHGQG